MAKLRSSNIEPSTATTLTLGASGDSVAVGSDSIKANTWQDTGGNNLFVSDGAGTLSNVNSGLAGGGYTLLQTVDIADADYVYITSNIDSTYKHYMFVFNNMYCSANNTSNLTFQGSINGGSSYGVDQTSTFFSAYNYNGGEGATLQYYVSHDDVSGTAYQPLTYIMSNDDIQRSSIIFHLYNPAQTVYHKNYTCRSFSVGPDGSARYCSDNYVAGRFQTASAIDALAFKMTAGDIKYGYLQMYGVS